MASGAEAIRLYRAIYRLICSTCVAVAFGLLSGAQAAAKMPTRDRRDYVRRRLRFEYDQCRQETRPERIDFLLRLAETQLETVQVQAEHLASTFSSPDYHRT